MKERQTEFLQPLQEVAAIWAEDDMGVPEVRLDKKWASLPKLLQENALSTVDV